MGDLFAVCKAVQAPVLARDWFLHPIQASAHTALKCTLSEPIVLVHPLMSRRATSMTCCRPAGNTLIIWRPGAVLQIVDARDAGAAGALGIVHQVTADGSSVLSSFAAALGLEAPVEVHRHSSQTLEKRLRCCFGSHLYFDCSAVS